jgi:hypothetical protein
MFIAAQLTIIWEGCSKFKVQRSKLAAMAAFAQLMGKLQSKIFFMRVESALSEFIGREVLLRFGLHPT